MEQIEATVSFGDMPEGNGGDLITRAELEAILEQRLGSIRVCIPETGITRAQENARIMAGNAEF